MGDHTTGEEKPVLKLKPCLYAVVLPDTKVSLGRWSFTMLQPTSCPEHLHPRVPVAECLDSFSLAKIPPEKLSQKKAV